MSFNSREFEFADIKVSMLGVTLEGLRGLTYKKSWEKEVVYGAGNEGRAVQRGNKKYEGSLSLLKSDMDVLDQAARDAGYDGIVDVPGKLIDITCVYQKEEDKAGLSSVGLINVEFTEFEDGMKQGDKFKEVTLPFIFLRLKQQ
ncbi:MAG: hypothetical protein ABS68_00255 [Niastella sp. SCN 39-18]|nr:hypothetical protein [Sphingobacteriales bacterium]ODT55183.1 MAG: hypothetical protein ABS68_00255 [Niastella sp. SCN 39-18]OJW09105.1 MAG: hypothetical protein BGO53_00150 [Sphingobacteriales bacterium 39-19]